MEKKKRLTNYPLYEHTHITNVKQLIEENARRTPDHLAFRYLFQKEVKSVTYKQFYEDVIGLGLFLRRQGFQNRKIALLGENSYDWILTYFATVLSSNIIVPIDKELSDDEIGNLLSFCDAEVLIHSELFANTVQKMFRKGQVQKVFSMKNFPTFFESVKGIAPDEKATFQEDIAVFQKEEVDEDAVCSIIFTSGTTGKPKGVMLSQRNLMADAFASARYVYLSGPSLLTLPLHHTFAFTAGVLGVSIYGLPICISKSLRTFKSDLQTFKPQHIFLVPLYVETLHKTIWNTARQQKKGKLLKALIMFSNLARKCGLDFRKKLFHSILEQFGGNLELLVSGGAPLSSRFAKGLEDIGIQVLNGYGITECAPVVAVNRNQYCRNESVGLPLSCCDVKIEDGEIWVKGANVMLGYYHDEAATRETLEDGWFKTGDLGYLDEDGFLYVTGRKKNLVILSNGENVSPEELEEKLQVIEHVQEVIVYEKDGSLAAEIYVENEEEIQNKIHESILELNRKLPAYKRIQRIFFRDSEFEKTTTKKIKRQ